MAENEYRILMNVELTVKHAWWRKYIWLQEWKDKELNGYDTCGGQKSKQIYSVLKWKPGGRRKRRGKPRSTSNREVWSSIAMKIN